MLSSPSGGPATRTPTTRPTIPPTFLAATANATTVSLLGSVDDQPVVLYTTSGGGVFVERPGLAPTALSECQAAPGEYITSSATFSTQAGFWLGAWSKVAAASDTDDGYLTTNGRGIYCSEDACAGDMNECTDGTENNLVRNPASVAAYRTGDPLGRTELVQAIPTLGADGGEVMAGLLLTQQSIDFRSLDMGDPKAENIAPPLVLAVQATVEPDFRGPDLPAIAFSAPDRFAVAWTQPSATGSGDELRLQRYKMCLPPPEQ